MADAVRNRPLALATTAEKANIGWESCAARTRVPFPLFVIKDGDQWRHVQLINSDTCSYVCCSLACTFILMHCASERNAWWTRRFPANQYKQGGLAPRLGADVSCVWEKLFTTRDWEMFLCATGLVLLLQFFILFKYYLWQQQINDLSEKCVCSMFRFQGSSFQQGVWMLHFKIWWKNNCPEIVYSGCPSP